MRHEKLEKVIKGIVQDVLYQHRAITHGDEEGHIKRAETAIDQLKIELGWPSVIGYLLKPALTVSEKIDSLYKHLGLEIKRIEKESQIIVQKIKKEDKKCGGK